MIDRRVLLLLLVVLLVACGGEAAEDEAVVVGEAAGEMTAVRLPMGYIPDPQYAPFYVALEKGYYADEGFEIEFDYSFETDGVALVGAGELPFAIVSGDQVILARAQEVPVVYVMEWFQRFPIAVISKAAAGIERAEDLAGRQVGLPGFFGASYVGYAGLLEAAGLSQADVNAEDIGFTQVEALLTDQAEAVVGYANNEPLQLTAQGEAINVIYVADVVDMVANGLITNEALIEQDPEQVRRFVRATLRGLDDTLADPAGAFEISKQYVEGLDDERYGVLEASLPLWEAEEPGLSDLASWQKTEEALLAIGFLDGPLADLEAAFSNEFVED
jgi:NitT/TauT family transport system substrate-binding protein